MPRLFLLQPSDHQLSAVIAAAAFALASLLSAGASAHEPKHPDESGQASQRSHKSKPQRSHKSKLWVQTISDKQIVDAANKGIGDLWAEVIPHLNTESLKLQRKARHAKLDVTRRSLHIAGRPALLISLEADDLSDDLSNIFAGKCSVVVVLTKPPGQETASVLTHKTLCSAGITSEELGDSIVALTPKIPLIWTTWRQQGSQSAEIGYDFYRIDHGRFERVLELRAEEPLGYFKEEACTHPIFRGVQLFSSGGHQPKVKGPDGKPAGVANALTATWVCQDPYSAKVDSVRSRIWTWDNGKFKDATPEKLNTFPLIMGGTEE